ncbi:MAG: hypothetical protein HY063_02020 [Bacteroidetes bacterium]|nr:hypothetical protein [Bacteroidota bacterium]
MKQKLSATGQIPTKSGRAIIFSFFALLALLAWQNNSYGQAILKFGGTATYIKLSNGTSGTPIYLVVDNPANTAIQGASSTAGWIISESDFNYVKWDAGTTVASYIIPFGYNTSDYIPFTFNKTSAGSANFYASTYHTAASDNLPYAYSSPTAIFQGTGGTFTNDVIDRWWRINVSAAATADMTFSYPSAENTLAASNTDVIKPQRWNGTGWDAPVGAGSNAVTSGVGTVNSGSISSFSPWVLSRASNFLPLEWLSLSTGCDRADVIIKWSTATEQNSDFFTVEKSSDGNNFTAIAAVPASGNSSTVKNYSAVDRDAYGTNFYRVRETDHDGTFSLSETVAASGCAGDNVNIYAEGGSIMIDIAAAEDGKYAIELFTVLGQRLDAEQRTVLKGNNHIKLMPELASAVYCVKVYPIGNSYGVSGNNNTITKKVFIRSTE